MQALPKALGPRSRKFLGAAGLLLFISIYVVVAASLGALLGKTPIWVQTLYYGVAGLAWALPLRPLIRWMNRADVTPSGAAIPERSPATPN